MKPNFFPLLNPNPGDGGAPGGTPGNGAPPAGGTPPGGAGGAGGAPAPWHSSFIKADGTLDHSALDRLPDNLKPLTPTLATLKTGEDLLAKIQNLNVLAGRKGLAPLPANASPEDIAAQTAVLRAVQGVPEKPEGYGFKRPDDLPEEAWNEAHATAASALLHKHNASPALAKDLLALQANMVKESIAAQQKYEADFFAGQDNDFRAALAKTGDDYDKVMNVVNLTAQKFGMPADSPLLRNAHVRLMLHSVAKAIGEPEFKGGGGQLQTQSDEAIANSIIHDKTNPDYEAYWNGQHAKNGEVKKRVAALLESAAKAKQLAAAGGKR